MKKIKIIEAGRLSKNEMKLLIGGSSGCIQIYGSSGSTCAGYPGTTNYTTYSGSVSGSSGSGSLGDTCGGTYLCGAVYLTSITWG